MKFSTGLFTLAVLALAHEGAAKKDDGKGKEKFEEKKLKGIRNGLFKLRPKKGFCYIKEEEELEFDVEEEVDEIEVADDDEVEKDYAKSILHNIVFFCAADLRQCGYGPQDGPSCPEIVVSECAQCLDGFSRDLECLCECEQNSTAVQQCVKHKKDDDDKSDAGSETEEEEEEEEEEEDDDKKGNGKGDDKKGNGKSKGKDKDDRRQLDDEDKREKGKKIAAILDQFSDCLAENWETVSPVCKNALIDLTGNETTAESFSDAISTAARIYETADLNSAASTEEKGTAPEGSSVPVGAIVGSVVGVAALAAAGVVAYKVKSRRDVSAADGEMVPVAKSV